MTSSRTSFRVSAVWSDCEAEHPMHQDFISQDAVMNCRVTAMQELTALLVQMSVVQEKNGLSASCALTIDLVS